MLRHLVASVNDGVADGVAGQKEAELLELP